MYAVAWARTPRFSSMIHPTLCVLGDGAGIAGCDYGALRLGPTKLLARFIEVGVMLNSVGFRYKENKGGMTSLWCQFQPQEQLWIVTATISCR